MFHIFFFERLEKFEIVDKQTINDFVKESHILTATA